MKPSIQKLQKFLKLEAERGYDNRAVMGGLDRMLAPWEAEARAESVPEELVQAVVARLRDYPHLSPRSRAETLEGLWRRIQRETKENLPPLTLAAEGKKESGADKPAPPKKPARPQKAVEVKKSGHQVPAAEEIEQIEPEEAASGTENQIESAPVAQPRVHTNARPVPDGPAAALNASITVLAGVGPRHAQTLGRLSLYTLRDMLYYFPRRYDDYSQLKPINRLFYGEEVTVIGTIQSVVARPIRGGQSQIVEAIISDGTGAVRINWFNQNYIAKRLQKGQPIAVSGKIDQYLGRLVMKNPECEPLDQQNLHTNRIVPVYPLTATITQRWLRKLMFQVVEYWAPRVQDHLPPAVRQSAGLTDLPTALLETHFPNSADKLKAARQRLAFDEIFLLQFGVLRQKRAWQDRTARVFEVTDEWLQSQLERLPFPLTGAQQRALQDVRSDLAAGRPMNRLLQGDVGSGKTVIAALAAAVQVQHGAQAAMMAPTGILAEQHYQSLLRLLAGVQDEAAAPVLKPEQIRLMVGATPESEKKQIREGLASGEIKLVVGTHALIEDPVVFADLQLAIVDEQHRFGVEQRALLRSKGNSPHLLVMTATPIPRSLALTVYGDLDLSVMDEMPAGRQPVETHVFYPLERERAYAVIRGQLEQKHQSFIIYPLVEESENGDTLAAVSEQERLQKQIFPKYEVGLLHGRMKADEKEAVMARFRDGEIHVLVSTSVVEVGVDVPNATVMLIEGCQPVRAWQLHQFRGRVGRGHDQSYCLLIPDTAEKVENERLQVMVETNDGFVWLNVTYSSAAQEISWERANPAMACKNCGWQTYLMYI
jgi:ATP-dependent DNA helicase RecG